MKIIRQDNQLLTPEGKLICTIKADGSLSYQPGKKSSHSAAVEEFLAAGQQADPAMEDTATPPAMEDTATPPAAEDTGTPPAAEDTATPPAMEDTATPAAAGASLPVEEIPDSLLPPFSKILGVDTPGFKTFVKKHRLSPAEQLILIRRLENQ